MILVIDGYNLLNEMYKGRISKDQLNTFLHKMANYGIIKNHYILIVFDGYDCLESHKNYKNMALRFSKDISADDYIKDYIFNNRSKELAVVSSDLEIYKAASRLGIVTIKSAAFASLLNSISNIDVKQQKIKLQGPIQKIVEDSNHELDELMKLNQVYYKPEETENFKSTNQKLSKVERKLLRITKKL